MSKAVGFGVSLKSHYGKTKQKCRQANLDASLSRVKDRVDALVKQAEGMYTAEKARNYTVLERCSNFKPSPPSLCRRYPSPLPKRKTFLPPVEMHSNVEQLDQRLLQIRQKEDQESPFGKLLPPETAITVAATKEMPCNYNLCTKKGIKKLPLSLPPEKRTEMMEIKAQRSGLRGKIVSVNGDEYTGEWKDDKKHGKGTQVWKKSGVIYGGEWKFGQCDGYGTYIAFHPKTKMIKWMYSGDVQKGKKHGYGECVFESAAFYDGEWCEGRRSGWGRLHSLNGDEYEGEWLNDKMHGEGTMRYANGSVHEGFWKDGKKHGKGMFYDSDRGRLYEGLWIDGTAKCGVLSDRGRDGRPIPKEHPMPPIYLMDVEKVLQEAEPPIF